MTTKAKKTGGHMTSAQFRAVCRNLYEDSLKAKAKEKPKLNTGRTLQKLIERNFERAGPANLHRTISGVSA